jgi:hypothetical protein
MPQNTIDSNTILGLMGLFLVNMVMPSQNVTSFRFGRLTSSCSTNGKRGSLMFTMLYRSHIMLVLIAKVRYTVSTIEAQICRALKQDCYATLRLSIRLADCKKYMKECGKC